MADAEESAPLLDIENQPNNRASEEEPRFPFIIPPRDDGSSKESSSPPTSAYRMAVASPHPLAASGELPLPTTQPSSQPRRGLVSHTALLLPRIVLTLLWFCFYLVFGGGSVVYMLCWLLMQIFTGFTKAERDVKMLRRDLGGLFNGLMDMFERIWD